MKRIVIAGHEVSPVCLGGVDFGTKVDAALTSRMLDGFLAQGGNFVDTANCYGRWAGDIAHSERAIGAYLKQSGKRSEVILSTKGAHPPFSDMRHSRLSEEDIRADLCDSLKNLQTDHIDLYFLHRDDTERSVEQIITLMEQLKKEGKICAYGASNWTLTRLQQAQAFAQANGFAGFSCNQMLFSLAEFATDRISDKTLVPMDEAMYAWHAQTGLSGMAYTSTAKGYFAKLAQNRAQEKNLWPYQLAKNDVIYAQLQTLQAEFEGYTMQQLSLLFFAGVEFAVAPIVSCSNMAQLEEVTRLLTKEPPQELICRLRKLRGDLIA